MCGIGGIVLDSAHAVPDLRERLAVMADAMIHRGPDDGGIFVTPNSRAGLANRRLAIRDLSLAGHMPMGNADGSVWITYNGEIYNADELRSELERVGYVFHSRSDTEVILHGYEAWGAEVVGRLRGMFAMAIMRVERESGQVQQLLLARDPLGIKPLYYTQTGNQLVFASELKALHAARLCGTEIDLNALAGYLMLGSVPNPLTIYREVQALPPGSLLQWENGQITQCVYWRLPTEVDDSCDEAGAVEAVRALLHEAVRIRLVSDVPLGAFLSGGLDSSAIVALMRAATNGTIRTCSMVFDEAEYNEGPFAQAMAEAVGAEHYERRITADDVRREFPAILRSLDQPSVDGVNAYFVSQTARQAGLTVALSGLGGDELFGGYPNTFQGVPQMLRAIRWIQRVPGGVTLAQAGLRIAPDGRRRRVDEALGRPAGAASAYLVRRGMFGPDEARSLLTDDMAQAVTFDPVRHIADRADPAGGLKNGTVNSQWISRAELSTYMHHQLLRDTDVMSMAHSLEVRVPLIDRVLVETVLRFPERVLQAGSGPKPLLRRAIGDLLPDVVTQRTDKRGFTFPFALWLHTTLRPEMQAAFEQVKDRGWLNAGTVDAVWRDYEAGRAHWSRVWALAALNCIAV